MSRYSSEEDGNSAERQKSTWVLTLNKYQRDNLLWLVNLCGWPDGKGVGDFLFANTGDWLGELGFMLEGIISRDIRPNVSREITEQRIRKDREELRKYFDWWTDQCSENQELLGTVMETRLLPARWRESHRSNRPDGTCDHSCALLCSAASELERAVGVPKK